MKNTRSIIRWFWTILKRLRLQVTLNAIIGVLCVGIDFAFIWATKHCIDIATLHREESIRPAAYLLIIIILCQTTIGFARKWIGALLGVKAQNQMQLHLFHRLLKNEWTGREAYHSGDILNRLIRDVNDVTNTVTETIPSVFSVLTRLGGAFLFMFTMDPKLACMIIAIVPIFIAFSRMYVNRMRRLTREIRKTDSAIQSLLQESILHRVVLKTLGRIKMMARILARYQMQLRSQVRHRTVFSSVSGTLISMGFATGYLVTFLWGVNRLHDGLITYGMMIAYIQLVGQIQGPFREMIRFIPVIISSFTAGERLMELEDAPMEEEGKPIRYPDGAGLRLNHVTFRYWATSRDILEDFSYDFPPGSRTAILGETGAGKTTLIRIILALLRPTEGTAEIYNKEGQSSRISPLTRCNLVYVPQGNTLFSGTIRNNLLLGDPKATEDEMREVLKIACADFVMELPDGIDTPLGEDNAGLSQGQAQRVCIARALLRKGSILLLDEATSALDNETEARLLKNLSEYLRPEQTLLFITHREAVIDYCTQTLHLTKKKSNITNK